MPPGFRPAHAGEVTAVRASSMGLSSLARILLLCESYGGTPAIDYFRRPEEPERFAVGIEKNPCGSTAAAVECFASYDIGTIRTTV